MVILGQVFVANILLLRSEVPIPARSMRTIGVHATRPFLSTPSFHICPPLAHCMKLFYRVLAGTLYVDCDRSAKRLFRSLGLLLGREYARC